MSAQGRVTGQIMEAYCGQNPSVLPCRLIEGDLWWIGGLLLLVILCVGLVIPAITALHKAVKTGKLSRLLSWARFWKWFREKENTVPVIVIAVIPAMMFLPVWPLSPAVWLITAFIVYLIRNWNKNK